LDPDSLDGLGFRANFSQFAALDKARAVVAFGPFRKTQMGAVIAKAAGLSGHCCAGSQLLSALAIRSSHTNSTRIVAHSDGRRKKCSRANCRKARIIVDSQK